MSAHGHRLLEVLRPHVATLRDAQAKHRSQRELSATRSEDDDEDVPLSRRRELAAAAAEARAAAGKAVAVEHPYAAPMPPLQRGPLTGRPLMLRRARAGSW